MFPKTSLLLSKGGVAGKEMSESLSDLLGPGLKLRLLSCKALTLQHYICYSLF